MKTDYETLYTYINKKLEKNSIAVLATADRNGKVTARAMSIIHDGLQIYFQTDARFTKVKQIKENNQVAMTFENIQIEGVAENCGHSSLNENRWFCNTYREMHPGSFEMYTMLPNQSIFRVKPILITCWMYKEGRVYRDYMYCKEKKALREYYDAIT